MAAVPARMILANERWTSGGEPWSRPWLGSILAVATALALVFALGIQAAKVNPQGMMRFDWSRLPPPPPVPVQPPSVPAGGPVSGGPVVPPVPGYSPTIPPPEPSPGFTPSNDAEREMLDLNPRIKAYLARQHSIPVGSPDVQIREFRWEDERTRLVWEACTVYYDPTRAGLSFEISAALDEDAFRSLERQFGVPGEVLGWRYLDSPEMRRAEAAMLAARAEVAGHHGVRIEPGRISVDETWIVRHSAPQLRGLAEEVLRAWTPAGDGPRYPDWLEALTSFVQEAVPYERIPPSNDGLERFGVRTPGMTVLLGGDCDSKSLLLASLIRALDPDLPIALVVFRGVPEWHAMLGVGVADERCANTIEADGQRYVLIETTDGWGIGRLHPDFNLSDIDSVEPID